MTHSHDHSDADKISCDDVLAHLVEFLNGEVDEKKKAEIDLHLETCRSCYSRADFERVLKKRLQDANTQDVPDRLKNRINRLLDDF